MIYRNAAHRLQACSSTAAYAHMVHLAGEIGVRVAGTDNEQAGIQYLAEVFSRIGYLPVIEAFPHPVWQEKYTRLETFEGGSIPAISPCFGGAGSIKGQVIPVGDPLTTAQLDNLDLNGKIAMVDGRDVEIDYPDGPQTDLLTGHGVIGIVYVAGKEQHGGLPQAYYNFKRWFHGGTPVSLIISFADTQQLRYKMVRMSVETEVRWSQSANVIAELYGSEYPDEWVIVSAHHDTTATSPGASDNAGGCAIVTELARVFKNTGTPKRSIRFILFGGHETGLHGSEAWLRKHIAEIQQVVAVINFDGQGTLNAKDDALMLGSQTWSDLVEYAIKSSGHTMMTQTAPGGVDSTNFAVMSIPVVNFGRHGDARFHTPADNLNGTDPQGLVAALECSCVLLSSAADDLQTTLSDRVPLKQLHAARSYGSRWGWGIVV